MKLQYAVFVDPQIDSALGRAGMAWFTDRQVACQAARRETGISPVLPSEAATLALLPSALTRLHAAALGPFSPRRGVTSESLNQSIEAYIHGYGSLPSINLIVSRCSHVLALVPESPDHRLDDFIRGLHCVVSPFADCSLTSHAQSLPDAPQDTAPIASMNQMNVVMQAPRFRFNFPLTTALPSCTADVATLAAKAREHFADALSSPLELTPAAIVAATAMDIGTPASVRMD